MKTSEVNSIQHQSWRSSRLSEQSTPIELQSKVSPLQNKNHSISGVVIFTFRQATQKLDTWLRLSCSSRPHHRDTHVSHLDTHQQFIDFEVEESRIEEKNPNRMKRRSKMRFVGQFNLALKRSRSSQSFSRFIHDQVKPQQRPCSFGIVFDIDGVLIRGGSPIGGSNQALTRLYDDKGALRIPFLFLTNGGGVPESKRALELSKLLGIKIVASQVLQGHSPFKELVRRFENDLIIVCGKGEPDVVMSDYGYKNVLSIDEYASYFDNIDPLSHHKKWVVEKETSGSKYKEMDRNLDVSSERVQAVFVVSDPVDWSRDIQVLCDILRTGGLPGIGIGHQPPLYFANDDLHYQAAFPAERLGMGAFRIALEGIYNSIHPSPLDYTSYGKPNPFVFKNAERTLKQIPLPSYHGHGATKNGDAGLQFFKTLYMIGDNPSVDIKGARQAGSPWFSILTRTGVFRGKENHAEHPADLVVDTVADAVDYILKKEGVS